MDYQKFLSVVRQKAESTVGEEGKVSINHVIKNNGMELDGLVIMMNESEVSPTIYLNGFYEDYTNGRQIGEIFVEIMNVYNKNKDKLSIGADFFLNYEKIKGRIVYKVINYSQNKKLLETIPYKRILDLAVVFYCLVDPKCEGSATALIYNSHLLSWGVTDQDVYEAALENTPRLMKSVIRKMSDIIREMFYDEMIEQGREVPSTENMDVMQQEFEADSTCDMYVLTNESKINGAACMLYTDVLKAFADETGADLFILPSSIHEVILIPKNPGICKQDLSKMVHEVNTEGVAREEILSDTVYVFSRGLNQITL